MDWQPVDAAPENTPVIVCQLIGQEVPQPFAMLRRKGVWLWTHGDGSATDEAGFTPTHFVPMPIDRSPLAKAKRP
jgi:hypothetical protein